MDFSRQSLMSIIDNLHSGLYIVDKDRTITFWNKDAARISGFSSEEMVGFRCSDNRLRHIDNKGTHLCNGSCPLSETLKDGTPREAEVYLHHKDGHRVPVWIRTSTLADSNDNITHCIELFAGSISQKANILRVQELEKLALLDNLTQLANRLYIKKELHIRFEEKKRLQVPFGILFIDIDNFKVFNDTYGHAIGDLVLRYVARTLTANTRAYDLFGRWGGDEFIGIFRNITECDLYSMGETLRMLIEHSFIIHNNTRLNVTVSIGATMVNNDDCVDSLINRADTLMYQSKKQGRNQLTVGQCR